MTWHVIDIAVRAAVGMMSGVMFWVFDGLSYGLFPLLTLILPGSAALMHALFYFPATLGLLIVRKPGAPAYVLLVASFIEVVLGTKYSVSLVVIALVQAAAAEAVFALFRYRRWTLGVTILAALAVGVVYNFYLLFFYYQAFSFFSPRGLIGTACELLSALVFAGFGSWGLHRALSRSGVLDRFASGR
ncbi:ECF transporter S component [Bifidobacterium catenulatum subsp. kashiwanohense]|uniref:ECF transporter S component n=1 Tax=Bifidobacterium catenulatum subsp. kashiwanohense TaxID=630129 RepID=A0AAJ1UNJ5_9BIFI|nr:MULTISPECIES: ECF transporter S component [Bifidobacterium]MDH7886390.1 ECF transporter S component [Bifidobacterium catenulatum subsp. kashiwanohense]MDH7888344.1 ECF transporter S component [Bifidobacterium catenulatum subsp. kashiwanohense]MDH7899949.1 ECF transporter S component [Bifidobacterium catenulatum subsp. kashiwanohense]MDH7902003.1 ECF transporter S component [Bifidobacterium catenulatum subsp. kashiwanohense]MDH7905861.1 ECF transporter S component [Bifidobacterium catenulatu